MMRIQTLVMSSVLLAAAAEPKATRRARKRVRAWLVSSTARASGGIG